MHCVCAHTAVNQSKIDLQLCVNDTFSSEIHICRPKAKSLLQTLLLTEVEKRRSFETLLRFPGQPSFPSTHSLLSSGLSPSPSHKPAPLPSDAILSPPQFTPLSHLPPSLPSPTPTVCHRESRGKVVAMIRKKFTISWMFLFSALQINASRAIYTLLCLCNEIQFFKT